MDGFWGLIIILGVWFVLSKYILPKIGVST